MKCRSFIVLILMLVIDVLAEQPLAESTIVLYNKAASGSVYLAKF